MPGIFPDSANGGLVRRDTNGVCQTPVGVQNAYCPPAMFTTTCEVTALPSDCTARISAAQINAIVSEMLCLAATINPNGTWNCASLCNMASAFTAWAGQNKVVDGATITGAGTTADPWKVSVDNLVTEICNDTDASLSLAGCVLTDLCANEGLNSALALCLIDQDANNGLVVGPNGGLFAGGLSPATSTQCGCVMLSTASDYPADTTALNDTDAVTAAYLEARLQQNLIRLHTANNNSTVDTAISQGVWTTIPFPNQAFSGIPFGTMGGSTFTFNEAGTYEVSALARVLNQAIQNAGNGSNETASMRLLYNGTPIDIYNQAFGGNDQGNAGVHLLAANVIADLAPGDTLAIQVRADNGQNAVVLRAAFNGAQPSHRFDIKKLR